MENFSNFEDKKDILGWGVDADKSSRPASQMWKVPEQGTGAHWDMPEQQPNFRDFYSIERPRPTKVFGSSVPPKGLSGAIRKFAFNYSEGTFAHWMLLIFADRINVFEGIVDDVLKGTPPRLLKERGWEVDKKYKTFRYKKVMAMSVLALVGTIAFLTYSSKKSSGEGSYSS